MRAPDYDYFREDGTGVSEYELDQEFAEMLFEVFGYASIAGGEYDPAKALRDTDPIAYRCGFNDWVSGELYDGALYESDPTADTDDDDGSDWSLSEFTTDDKGV